MRRSDKEINDPEVIQEIFQEADVCRIDLIDGNEPYVVPMNFGYKDNILYLHSASEGRKIEILKQNNNTCFQMDIKSELVASASPCNWGMKYLSLIGQGKAYVISNIPEKKDALDVIMGKYSPEASFEYSDDAINEVVVIKVNIDSVTGKKSGY
ncbi:MAG: pyridoxamine 5'-phosphate oxidase family protein [Methanobacterium sp.]|jgi:hypothetical protein|nr:pyridoxamine 5'-phosphate oxidase family protein [Methanobacterium sp.]